MQVYPFLHPGRVNNGPLWSLGSTTVCAVVGGLSKLFLYAGTQLHTHNVQTLHDAVWKRPSNRPLITFSNHASTIDDPVLWGLLPMRTFAQPTHLRWSLGAQEICYKNRLLAAFFSFGRVIPIVRGNGVYQVGMDCAIDKLNQGGWIHIFPEAKVHQEGDILKLRWGIARLIMDCKQAPLILPIYHTGMSRIHPLEGGPLGGWFPRLFQSLHVAVGSPIDTQPWREEATTHECEKVEWRARDSRLLITHRVETALQELMRETENRIANVGES